MQRLLNQSPLVSLLEFNTVLLIVKSPLTTPVTALLITSTMPKSSSKDPNKPKGPKNIYNFFLQEEREALKKAGGDSTTEGNGPGFLDFSKACAEKWKTLSEGDKQRFKEAAEKDKLRYENEMANYTPPKSEVSGRKTRKAKKMKDPNQPKPAM